MCEVIKQRYERKYSFNGREPQLCFYLSADPLREAVETSYERFSENIGGELARQALKEDYTQLYRYLK